MSSDPASPTIHYDIASIVANYYYDSDDSDDYRKEENALTNGEEVTTTLKRKRRTIYRDRRGTLEKLMNDYFVPLPRYPESMFKRRFRMSSRLFNYILSELKANFPYFTQRKDAAGKDGIAPLQKVVAAMRMLAYGESGDRQDEYCGLAEKTAIDTRKRFCKAVVKLFSSVYLRKPSEQDIGRLMQENAMRGFPGMIGN